MSVRSCIAAVALGLLSCARPPASPGDAAAPLDHPADVSADHALAQDATIDVPRDDATPTIDVAEADRSALDAMRADRPDVTAARDVTASDGVDGSPEVRDVSVEGAADAPSDTPSPPHVFDASGPPAVYATRDIEVVRVFAGNDITMATDRDGALWAWGSNSDVTMQPGDWNDLYRYDDRRTRPQRIAEHMNVTRVELKGVTCALSGPEGMSAVYCWGAGAMFFYGTLTPMWDDWRLPRRMGTISDAVALRDYSAVVRSDHSLWGIAADDSGLFRSSTFATRIVDAQDTCYRLSDGTIQQTFPLYYDTSPQRLDGITSISAGLDFVCMLRNDGHVWCWGSNLAGQAGGFDESDVCYDRSDPSRPTFANCARLPREVAGLTDVVKVSAGGGVSCAIKRDGTVWCWGYDHRSPDGLGDIGDGRAPDELCAPFQFVDGVRREYPEDALLCRRRPVQVVGIVDAVDVSVGLTHACVVRATGQLLCWGSNFDGQLGDGTRIDHSTPAPVRWH